MSIDFVVRNVWQGREQQGLYWVAGNGEERQAFPFSSDDNPFLLGGDNGLLSRVQRVSSLLHIGIDLCCYNCLVL